MPCTALQVRPDDIRSALQNSSTEYLVRRSAALPNAADDASASNLTACLAAGRTAYRAKLAEVGEVGTCGFVWVAIEITPETKPAIRWLNEGDHGRLDGWALHFRVDPRGFLDDEDTVVQSLTVQEAGCEALAAALREAGCPCRVDSRVD